MVLYISDNHGHGWCNKKDLWGLVTVRVCHRAVLECSRLCVTCCSTVHTESVKDWAIHNQVVCAAEAVVPCNTASVYLGANTLAVILAGIHWLLTIHC
jgi:hypothetical protein